MRRTMIHTSVAVVAALALSACGRSDGANTADGGEPESVTVVTPDNVIVVDSARIAAGPSLSGSLRPENVAQIRAELAGAMVNVSAERGQRVSRGAVLGRIDDTAVRDNFLSARSALTTAEQAAALAARNVERSEAPHAAGAIAESALEDARLQLQVTESQRADAQARLALAQSQLEKTTVRAPFAGVVAERMVAAGDIVQPGTALFTVVDPSSMRLEAAIRASDLARARRGASVEFTVAGYAGRTFEGRITSISPTTDPASGQIPVIANLPNVSGELVGGLYAEGRIAAESRVGLVVPLAAVDLTERGAEVLRMRGGVVEKVPVQTGLRDDRSERIEVTAGIAPGDTLLIGAARSISPGTSIRVRALESSAAAR